MLTIFGTPRAFSGHFGLIQRNAIKSWQRLTPTPQILLMGNDEGTAEACVELGVIHVPDIECNEFGTPLVSSMIARAEELAKHDLLALVSTDILLFNDTIECARVVSSRFDRFCAIACKQDIDLRTAINFGNPAWEQQVRALVDVGLPNNVTAGDLFLYPKGFWGNFPPFTIGRCVVDNWMFHRTLACGGALIDMTPNITVLHQKHDYSHHPDGKLGVWHGVEAKRNLELAGGYSRVFFISDANWVLTPEGLRKPKPSFQRWRRSLETLPALHPYLTIPCSLARSIVSPTWTLHKMMTFMAATKRLPKNRLS